YGRYYFRHERPSWQCAWLGLANCGCKPLRWQTDGTETGTGNAGSDNRLFAFSDAGASLGEVIRFTRSNGNVTWNNNNTFTDPTYLFNGTIKVGTAYNNGINLMNGGTWTITPSPAPSLQNYPFLFNASLTSGGTVVAP